MQTESQRVSIGSRIDTSVDDLEGIHWFQLHHSHQASASASMLAKKIKRFLELFKSINADTPREHGLKLLLFEECLIGLVYGRKPLLFPS